MKINFKKIHRSLFFLMAFAGLVVSFQNCGQSYETLKGAQTTTSQTTTDPQSPVANTPSTPTNTTSPQPPTSATIPTSPTSPTTPTAPTPPLSPSPAVPTNPNRVNVFLASGHMARTVMSCDDGRTWIQDQSANPQTRCWVDGSPQYVECDHTPFAGRGLDYNDGYFFANFGWGYDGSVRRSRDGIRWETLRSDGWGHGVAYANGNLFVNWGEYESLRSTDSGQTWTPNFSPRLVGFEHPEMARTGSYFFVIGRTSRANKFAFSRDQGLSWVIPSSLQSGWVKVMAVGGPRLVVIGYSATGSFSAVSLDSGTTWTQRTQSFVNNSWSELIFDGEKFVSWSAGRRLISFDGLEWMSQPFTVQNRSASSFEGPVSYDPQTRTFVRILSFWGGYYSEQRAYRSTDGGLTWTAQASLAGHPLRHLVWGQVDRTACGM